MSKVKINYSAVVNKKAKVLLFAQLFPGDYFYFKTENGTPARKKITVAVDGEYLIGIERLSSSEVTLAKGADQGCSVIRLKGEVNLEDDV